MGIKVKKAAKKSTINPMEWKLTLHRGTNCALDGSQADNFARFGKTFVNGVSSFGWIYIPLEKAKQMQTLEVKVIELTDK